MSLIGGLGVYLALVIELFFIGKLDFREDAYRYHIEIYRC